MPDATVLTEDEMASLQTFLDNCGDPIRARMDWMRSVGLVEVHPDDGGKPWGEQRLRRTAKGDAFFAGMDVALDAARDVIDAIEAAIPDEERDGSEEPGAVVVDEFFMARASEASRQAELVEQVYGPVAAEIVAAFLRAIASEAPVEQEDPSG